MILLNVEDYQSAPQLIEIIQCKFLSGIETIVLIQGKEIIGIVFSRKAIEKSIAREAVELCLKHVEILENL